MRVGVLGGTFDPPHVGHLVAARDALETLGLHRVLFVPAHRSPFKTGDDGTSPAVRLAMVEEAVADDAEFEVSRVEVDRPAPSFTVDTLRILARREPDVEWTLLLGVDQWAAFGEWREPREIARLARIAILTRDGRDPAAVDPGVEVPWTTVPVTRLDVSSSELRARAAAGRTLRHLVPDAVRAFIESKELYAPC